jgi:hypothetical protein
MEAPLLQIDTSMGSFQVELYYKQAPKTTKNFEELAKKGYYDGTVVRCLCSRLLPAPRRSPAFRLRHWRHPPTSRPHGTAAWPGARPAVE